MSDHYQTQSGARGGSSSEARQAYAEHERTYRGFLALSKWFVIHVALILIGLYFVTIQGMLYLGGMFWLLALALMGYGLVNAALRSTPRH
ncbi:aa3-type cytochrome c oxidase subunit IV [Pelagibacterium xiamenense]|uniref:aa3-type cytochrome c oxidase subunit IV n=1 Tax=Pelagibacterium xiamenense TaxID=2901140 RepID=UPI001E65AEBB|nr:aa3-type cytochrome c oxidase subunit IV [Pelagibacterium xiamenense]MCD7058651.1 aa3-type cytochrome c oxidase subunit IV [Pelagibacterium xiamenense]